MSHFKRKSDIFFFSQPSTTGTQDLYGISAHPSVLPSEVKLVGSDGVTFTLVLSPNTSTDTLPKSGNPGDEFDFISQVSVSTDNQSKLLFMCIWQIHIKWAYIPCCHYLTISIECLFIV